MDIQAFQRDKHLLVRLRATGSETHALRIAFLLDVSDSMAHSRLTAVKRTLHAARTLWIPEDRVTIVTFGNVGSIRLYDHPMSDINAFYAVVDSIQTDGCTNLSDGLEVLHGLHTPWDAVILLTDGQVNMGIMSTAGLYEMARSIGSQAYSSIGYGADHNRRLLRDLAVQTRGSYTYAADDEMLPVSIGNILSGLRTEVQHRVKLTVPASYVCAEYGVPMTNRYDVGGMVADRDYWAVFVREGDVENPSTDMCVDVTSTTMSAVVPILVADTDDLTEQVLRCRAATALANVADAMEDGHYDLTHIAELKTELDRVPQELRARPLMLRLIGQIAEAMAAKAPRLRQPSSDHLLSTISAGAAYLSVQRGSQSHSAEDPDIFASPVQRTSSSTMRSEYRNEVTRL
jgi:Mg-chelatase subunit ChlD